MKRAARVAGTVLQALLLGVLLFVSVVYLARVDERVTTFHYERF